MKKRFLFALGIIVATSCIGLTSCKDEDDEPGSSSKTCSCTEYDPYDQSYITKQIDPSTFGTSSCSELANKFNSYDTGTTITCHS